MLDSKLSISNRIVGRDVEIKILQDFYRSIRDSGNDDNNNNNKRDFKNNSTSSICSVKSLSSVAPSKQKSSRNNNSNRQQLLNKRQSQSQSQPQSQRPQSRAIYVSGLSGTGKSALVTEALEEKMSQHSDFFCRGKFDIMSCHRPFSALMDALNELLTKVLISCNQGNNKQQQRAALKETIQTTCIPDDDFERQQLINLLPSLGRFLSMDRIPSLQLDNCSAASSSMHHHSNCRSSFSTPRQNNNLKPTIRSLLRVLVGEEHTTLCFFIDDLQVS